LGFFYRGRAQGTTDGGAIHSCLALMFFRAALATLFLSHILLYVTALGTWVDGLQRERRIHF